MTLAGLYRRRGEVDLALRLHEDLLARSDLSGVQREEARFELAQDFLKAGMLDRAEKLFEELAAEGVRVVAALEQIVAIFEQGRDWKHAIDAARRLEAAKGESRRSLVAQYQCELAEEAAREGRNDDALKLIKRALDDDRTCVRAWLALARLERGAGDMAGAIAAYRHAFDQDARFLPEVIGSLGECYAQAGDARGYVDFLAHAAESGAPALAAAAQARLMQQEGLDPTESLARALNAHPSRALLVDFLELLQRRPEAIAAGLAQPAASLAVAVRKLVDAAPKYRCGNCGFTARSLFWQCPTCRQWASIAPIEDKLG
ncbi:MAG TPA: hypothetical protein VHE37_17185 [Nevskiaceae bacterium]|nr:hypothetical protein [Nevskiaceae bacterium]